MAAMLHGYIRFDEHAAIALRDRFPNETPDLEWIEALGDDVDEWLVMTSDVRISRNGAEREAFRRAGLRAFAFAKGYQKMPLAARCANLIARWNEIEALFDKVSPPFMFEFPVGRNTKFKSLVSSR